MTEDEKEIEQQAVRWIRKASSKRIVIEKFASLDAYRPSEFPVLIFTAGSPGAGKTEFIKGLDGYVEQIAKAKPVIIDPDAVRALLPGYTGANSFLFQRAVSIAVDDLFRHVLKHRQNALIDGTLSDYDRALKNISAAVAAYGMTIICYIFQHPAIAWHFTQLREAVEGRNIRRQDFITKFLGAKETADKIKSLFKGKVILNVVLKDYRDAGENKAVAKVFADTASVEGCVPFTYTRESVKRILKDEAI